MSDTLESLEIEVKHNAAGADKTVSKLTDSIREMSKVVSDALTNLREYSTLLKELGGSVQKALAIPKLSQNKGPLGKDIQERIENANRYEIALHKVSDAVSKMNKAFKTGNENSAWRAREKELNAEAQVDKYRPVPAVSENLQDIIKTASEVDVLNHKLAVLKDALDDAFSQGDRDKAYQLRGEIIKVESAISKLSGTAKKSTGTLSNFIASIKRIAFYRFIRSIIKGITQAFQEGLQWAYLFSDGITTEGHRFSEALDSMKAATTTMKAQLGSAFIGLLTALTPVILQIINLVTKLADAISQIFAAFTGTTYLKAVDVPQKWADGANEAGKAAKEWKNQLMGFDEINKLTEPSSGGGSTTTLDPSKMFEDAPLDKWALKLHEIISWVEEHLDNILTVAGLIGTALLGWKLSSTLLNTLPNLFGEVGKKLGIGKALEFTLGITLVITGLTISWNAGKTLGEKGWDKMTLWEKISTFLGPAVTALGGALVGGAIAGIPGAAIGAVIGFGIGLVFEGLGFIEGRGAATINQQLEEKRQEIQTGLEGIKSSVLSFWDDLTEKVSEKSPGLGNALGLVKPTIENTFNDVEYILDLFFIRLEGFVQIIEDIMNGDWKKAWKDAKETAKKELDRAAERFWEFKGTVTEVITSIKDELKRRWDEIKTLNDEIIPNIINSIVEWFAGLPDKIGETISKFSVVIASWALDAIQWVNENVPNILNAITGWFEKLPDAMVDVGKNMIYGLWNGVLSVGNWLYSKISSYFGDAWNAIKDAFNGFGKGTQAAYVRTGKFASGGFPSEGSLFIANEAGPEMVGTIGGRTAVANNADIVAAIQNGVYQAVIAGNSNSGNGVKTAILNVNGKEFARATFNDSKAVARERGVSLVVT